MKRCSALNVITVLLIFFTVRWRDIHLFRWPAFPNAIWYTIPRRARNSSLAVFKICVVYFVFNWKNFKTHYSECDCFRLSKTNEIMAVIFSYNIVHVANCSSHNPRRVQNNSSLFKWLCISWATSLWQCDARAGCQTPKDTGKSG